MAGGQGLGGLQGGHGRHGLGGLQGFLGLQQRVKQGGHGEQDGNGGQGGQDEQGRQGEQGAHLKGKGGSHGLHGLQGLYGGGGRHGTTRHGFGPHGFLHRFLQHLGSHEERHTIILHFTDLQGPGVEHTTGQGTPQGGGRAGGGVHSNINSFLARGAPLILRMTSSNTPRRGLFTFEILTGPFSSALLAATTHLGPWHGSFPWTGQNSLGPILICDIVATISPLVPNDAGHGFPGSLMLTAFEGLVPAEFPFVFFESECIDDELVFLSDLAVFLFLSCLIDGATITVRFKPNCDPIPYFLDFSFSSK